MKKELATLKNFREKLYCLFPYRRDAVFNLLDALSSRGHESKSVIELSESKAFVRQYSSITDAISDGLSRTSFDKIEQLVFNTTRDKDRHLFFLDCTNNPRPWAKKLTEKSIIHAPNPAPGNKPICVGHQYSVLSFSPDKERKKKHWLLPLSVERVKIDEKGNEKGMQQLVGQIRALGITDDLSISIGDSLYGTEQCRKVVAGKKNVVHIFRLQNNRKIFYKPTIEELTVKGAGRKKTYGQKMVLSDSATHKDPEFTASLTFEGKKQRVLVELTQWNNLLIRGSEAFRSAMYPINLIRCIVKDEEGKSIFKRPLWIGVMGKRRHELDCEFVYDAYRQRYDIEHFFRFEKQKLLLNSYQTPDINNETSWWKFVPLAYIQLYLASYLGKVLPKPWERYLPEYKSEKATDSITVKTPAQTQRVFENILQIIGTPAKLSLSRGNPIGRKTGEKVEKRPDSPINFKNKKTSTRTKKAISSGIKLNAHKSEGEIIEKLLVEIKTKLKMADISTISFAEKLLL